MAGAFPPPPPAGPQGIAGTDGIVGTAPGDGRAPTTRSRWIIPFAIAVVAVVALAVVLVVVLTGDDAPSGPSTAAAAAVLRAFETSTDLERSAVNQTGSCLLGDLAPIVAAAPPSLAVSVAAGASRVNGASAVGRASDPWLHFCAVGDGDQLFSLSFGLAPAGDYHAWVVRSLPDSTVTFQDDVADGRATVVSYCFSTLGQPTFCEADWTDGVVEVGVGSIGKLEDEAATRAWVLAARNVLLERIEAADIEHVTLTTST